MSKLLDYKAISYSPSYLCNHRCIHCMLPVSVRSRDQYSEIVFQALLDGLPGEVSLVDITGGEPFLKPRRLLKLVKEVGKTNRASSVVTNGFWLQEEKRAERLLGSLRECGLRGIAVSIDGYHRPRLEKRMVLRLLKLCRKQKIRLMFKDIGSESLSRMEMYREYIERGDVVVRRVNLELVGQARALDPDSIRENSYGPCWYPLTPHVIPSGEVMACCSVYELEIRESWLACGNVLQEPLNTILDKMAENPIFLALVVLGPGGILQLAGGKKISLAKKKSKCEFCVGLMRNENIVERVRHMLDGDLGLRQELLAGYLLAKEKVLAENNL